jgi:hypothetical protein
VAQACRAKCSHVRAGAPERLDIRQRAAGALLIGIKRAIPHVAEHGPIQ